MGPSLSAPHAVMVLETLKACGLKEVIIFGWCGSLSPDLFPGEVFLPSRGHSFEGVSRHYPEAQSLPWSKGQETLKILLTESGFKVREGALASTDAPFRETEDFIIQLKKRRILAIDMEVSSLMQVGQALGIRISCALLVTDRLDKSWEDYRQKTQEVGLRIVRVIWDKLLCLPE
ncbi:phosphorylase family protein [Thermosulfuriphilus sp.]